MALPQIDLGYSAADSESSLSLDHPTPIYQFPSPNAKLPSLLYILPDGYVDRAGMTTTAYLGKTLMPQLVPIFHSTMLMLKQISYLNTFKSVEV